MRPPIWLLALSLCLGACKDKSSTSSATPPSAPEAPQTGQPAAAPPEARKTPEWPKVTSEQAFSAALVRVVAGGLPPKSYTGAILHRDEMADMPSMHGPNRFVLVLLSGWDEAQLRNPACRFFVEHNRTDVKGNLQSSRYMAYLVQFDKETGLAVLRYHQGLKSTVEVGYHLQRAAPSADRALALRAASDETAAPETSAQNGAPLLFLGGLFSPTATGTGNFQFPPPQNGASQDEGSALIASADKLIGFATVSSDGTAKIVSVEGFKLDKTVPVLKPTAIAFGRKRQGQIPFIITTETSGTKLTVPKAHLRLIDPKDPPAAGGSLNGIPVSYNPEKFHILNTTDGIKWSGYLSLPDQAGAEETYLLQLAWSPFFDELDPSLFSQTFTVKLKNNVNGEPVVETIGIENLNNPHQPADSAAATFAMEAEIRDFFEIADGREVLFHLGGPPYWKRFSMTQKAWLPLPPVNLSNAWLTGNLNALFLLDRGAAEVRKYSLPDLRPLGSVKLPTGANYVAILAGCNSEHGPLQVLATNGIFALSAETLQRRDFTFAVDRFMSPGGGQVRADDSYQAAGDGLSFISYRPGSPSGGYLHYMDDVSGTYRESFNWKFNGTGQGSAAVSSAFVMNREGWLNSAATPTGAVLFTQPPPAPAPLCAHWLSPVAPVIFREVPPDERSIPPRPSHIQCFSYYDSTPFAEVQTPELTNQPGVVILEQSHRIAFDPSSLRLGVISLDRKTWVVHQMNPLPGRTQPVLLNWPDATLQRGTEWRFKPRLLGGTDFSAELIGAKDSSLKVQNGEIVATIAPQELATLQLLSIKVPGKDAALTYYIPLHMYGSPLPVIFPMAASESVVTGKGASFDALAQTTDAAWPLRSTLHASTDPVREVLGPVANHLIFVTTAQRVEFFSLESRKIDRALPSPAKAAYFAGAEALFEYDLDARTLTRIRVPDGRPEGVMTLPNGLRLHTLSVGTAVTSPLTLVLEHIQGQTTDRLGGITVTTTYTNSNVVVVDSRTLQASGWGQPKMWQDEGKQYSGDPHYNMPNLTDFPGFLPAAHSGQFVTLPDVFLVLGRGLSFAVPFPRGKGPLSLPGQFPPSGSISGGIVANWSGTVFNGGIEDDAGLRGAASHVTPCGRYRLVERASTIGGGNIVSVQTVENHHPLFQLGRLALLDGPFTGMGPLSGSNQEIRRRLFVLGDSGPLVVLAAGGKAIQIVDFDIPRLAREVSPNEFHVTSQGPPCVMAGGTLDYQIEVNNPSAVATCRLRDESAGPAGPSLTPQGRLRFTAPQVTQPTRLQISTEIVGKDGQTVLHEFPVFVLPMPHATPPPAATPFVPRKSV